MVQVRRLAFLPTLQPEESFVSYIDRAAIDLEVSRTVLLQAFGLLADPQGYIPGLGADFTEEGYRSVEQATGLPRDQIESSLLRRFSRTAVDTSGLDLTSRTSSHTWARTNWAYILRSACCPGCVADTGAWKVHWRTPWQFLCPQHRCFTVTSCPSCGTTLYSNAKLAEQVEKCAGPSASIPAYRADGRQRVRRGKAHHCWNPVAEIPTVVVRSNELVDLQQKILALVDATGTESVDAQALIADLRSCMILALYLGTPGMLGNLDGAVVERFIEHCRTRDDESPRKGVEGPKYRAYSVTPTDPLLISAAVALAGEMILGPDPEVAADRFVGTSYADPALRARWKQLSKFWTAPPRVASHIKRAQGTRTYAIAANLDGRSRRSPLRQESRLSWRNVPQLFWQSEAASVTTALFDSGWSEHHRRFLSMALARQLSPELSTWTHATTALGFGPQPDTYGHLQSHRLRQSGRGVILEQFLDETIAAMEDMVDPIDYAQRRDVLSDLRDLDEQEWTEVVLSSGRKHLNRYWADRRPEAAAWVWVTATGGYFPLAPSLDIPSLPLRQRPVAANRYRQYFVPNGLPEVEPALTRLAESILSRRGLPGPLVQTLELSSDFRTNR